MAKVRGAARITLVDRALANLRACYLQKRSLERVLHEHVGGADWKGTAGTASQLQRLNADIEKIKRYISEQYA